MSDTTIQQSWAPSWALSWGPSIHGAMRIVVGLMFLEHGTGKLLGFPILPGLDKMPAAMMYGTGLLELIGGALIVIGLFTRPVAFILSGFMAVAFFMVHVGMSGTIFPALNGGEPAALYCFVFLFLAFAGPGRWSVDKG
jgi:putative oxidoreductase